MVGIVEPAAEARSDAPGPPSTVGHNRALQARIYLSELLDDKEIASQLNSSVRILLDSLKSGLQTQKDPNKLELVLDAFPIDTFEYAYFTAKNYKFIGVALVALAITKYDHLAAEHMRIHTLEDLVRDKSFTEGIHTALSKLLKESACKEGFSHLLGGEHLSMPEAQIKDGLNAAATALNVNINSLDFIPLVQVSPLPDPPKLPALKTCEFEFPDIALPKPGAEISSQEILETIVSDLKQIISSPRLPKELKVDPDWLQQAFPLDFKEGVCTFQPRSFINQYFYASSYSIGWLSFPHGDSEIKIMRDIKVKLLSKCWIDALYRYIKMRIDSAHSQIEYQRRKLEGIRYAIDDSYRFEDYDPDEDEDYITQKAFAISRDETLLEALSGQSGPLFQQSVGNKIENATLEELPKLLELLSQEYYAISEAVKIATADNNKLRTLPLSSVWLLHNGTVIYAMKVTPRLSLIVNGYQIDVPPGSETEELSHELFRRILQQKQEDEKREAALRRSEMEYDQMVLRNEATSMLSDLFGLLKTQHPVSPMKYKQFEHRNLPNGIEYIFERGRTAIHVTKSWASKFEGSLVDVKYDLQVIQPPIGEGSEAHRDGKEYFKGDLFDNFLIEDLPRLVFEACNILETKPRLPEAKPSIWRRFLQRIGFKGRDLATTYSE